MSIRKWELDVLGNSQAIQIAKGAKNGDSLSGKHGLKRKPECGWTTFH